MICQTKIISIDSKRFALNIAQLYILLNAGSFQFRYKKQIFVKHLAFQQHCSSAIVYSAMKTICVSKLYISCFSINKNVLRIKIAYYQGIVIIYISPLMYLIYQFAEVFRYACLIIYGYSVFRFIIYVEQHIFADQLFHDKAFAFALKILIIIECSQRKRNVICNKFRPVHMRHKPNFQ